MRSSVTSRRAAELAALAALVLALAGAGPAAAQPAGGPKSACIACHSQLEDEQLTPVTLWPGDVHKEVGLGCHDCHGGDPSPALAEDLDSMAPERGFKPAPSRLEIPEFCASCHSDLAYMRRFDPQARVDQLTEYRTSIHGMRNAEGDTVVAVCTDCHGVHGIGRASNPDSPVHAANVPGMCAKCHSNADKMAPYGHPVDQLDKYKNSVHGIALLDYGDVAAPACNDCHGNHGAAPPGVESVAYVCGQCHGRTSMLFRGSFKKELFDALEVPECSVCHGNHAIQHPAPSHFYGGSAPQTTHGQIDSIQPLTAEIGTLAAGESATLQWISVLPLRRPDDDVELRHAIEISAGGAGLQLDASVVPGPVLESLRTVTGEALTASLSIESLSGLPVRIGDSLKMTLELTAGDAAVDGVRVEDRPSRLIHTVEGSVCLTCHSVGDECDQATVKMYDTLVGLDQELRAAARLLEEARQAGMEVGEASFALKSQGETAAIEVRSLIHAFDPDTLVERADEGREIAGEALAAGQAAMDELQYRRKGLAVSLVLVLFVVVGLYMKIRQIDRKREVTP